MYDPRACRRLSLGVLCSAFASISNRDNDASEAEEWLRESTLADLALTELGISQRDHDLMVAIEGVKRSRIKMSRWRRDGKSG